MPPCEIHCPPASSGSVTAAAVAVAVTAAVALAVEWVTANVALVVTAAAVTAAVSAAGVWAAARVVRWVTLRVCYPGRQRAVPPVRPARRGLPRARRALPAAPLPGTVIRLDASHYEEVPR